tara:strand:+ start:1998 stop:2225 length:228 start_codon:yes stop_codon:yes gene_type:complete
MNSLTSEEQKILTCMKLWVKISIASSRDGGTHKAFTDDWGKLQNSIAIRVKDFKEYRKIKNSVAKEMEQYIDNLN